MKNKLFSRLWPKKNNDDDDTKDQFNLILFLFCLLFSFGSLEATQTDLNFVIVSNIWTNDIVQKYVLFSSLRSMACRFWSNFRNFFIIFLRHSIKIKWKTNKREEKVVNYEDRLGELFFFFDSSLELLISEFISLRWLRLSFFVFHFILDRSESLKRNEIYFSTGKSLSFKPKVIYDDTSN